MRRLQEARRRPTGVVRGSAHGPWRAEARTVLSCAVPRRTADRCRVANFWGPSCNSLRHWRSRSACQGLRGRPTCQRGVGLVVLRRCATPRASIVDSPPHAAADTSENRRRPGNHAPPHVRPLRHEFGQRRVVRAARRALVTKRAARRETTKASPELGFAHGWRGAR